MKKVIVGAVIAVAAIAVIAFLVFPILQKQLNGDMSVTFYDQYGKPLPPIFGFQHGDQQVTTFSTALSYTVTFDKETAAISVGASVLVEVFIAGQTTSVNSQTQSNLFGKASDTFSSTWSLSNLVPLTDEGKSKGWTVKVTGSLLVNADFQDGSSDTASWNKSLSFNLTWAEATGIVLTGTLTWS
jgi:hypothetical protein